MNLVINKIIEILEKLEVKVSKLEKRCDLFNKLDTESAKVEQSLQKQINELKEMIK